MPPAEPTLDADSAARLRGVVARLSRQFNRFATLACLTPSQASALGVIAHRGPLTIGELTRIEGLNPTMMSRVVGRLDELELIERRAHPEDQRAAIVEATARGRELSTRIAGERAAVLAAVLAELEKADREQILGALPAFERLEARLLARGEPRG
jgi:DNA-binding MarR family transcriptional regulator